MAITTIAFDIAALEIFSPLLTGASVVIAAKEMIGNPIALAECIDRTETTILQATPTLWNTLVADAARPFPNLTILVGGEAASGSLADQAAKLLAACSD